MGPNAGEWSMTNDDMFKGFKEWAASWDCKEAETVDNSHRWYGDEIGVGGLWQDKSQKDFKSYL